MESKRSHSVAPSSGFSQRSGSFGRLCACIARPLQATTSTSSAWGWPTNTQREQRRCRATFVLFAVELDGIPSFSFSRSPSHSRPNRNISLNTILTPLYIIINPSLQDFSLLATFIRYIIYI